MPKVTTTQIGREIVVTVEAQNAISTTAQTETIDLDGTGLYSRADWTGLTIDQIKQNYRIYLDGANILLADETTLESDGEVNFNFPYSGTAYYEKIK